MSTFNDIQIIGEFYGVTANKGDIIVNDGVKNTSLPVGLNNYVLTADSTQSLGVKWALPAGVSIENNQYVLTSSPISTNSTIPIPITEFTVTPMAGNYVVLIDLIFSMSKFNRNSTFGLYKNGVLISNSIRIIDSFKAFFRMPVALSMQVAFSGTEIFTVRINTNDQDVDITLHEGVMILIKFSNMIQHTISNNNFITNYTFPITITNTIETPILGVYLVLYNCTFYTTLNRRTVTFGMYKNDILISGTERSVDPISNLKYSFEVHHIVSFTGSETFTMKVNTSNLDVDIIILNRNLMLIPL